jgi:hypothetical protein
MIAKITVTQFRGSNPGRGKRVFSSPERPDRFWGPRAHQRGGGERSWAAARPNLPKPKLKKKHFVDMLISKVARELPFSRNQPLKSVDDQYIRILKNKLIKLKKNK